MSPARDNRTVSSVQLIVTCAAILNILVSTCYASQVHVQKRSALQLCNIISYHTKLACTDFNHYGCFCGMGKSCNKPVDPIDECCQKHDACYGNFDDCYLSAHKYHYSYTCPESNDFNRTCQCSSTWTCLKRACECDVEFGRCLQSAQNKGHYDQNQKVKSESWSDWAVRLVAYYVAGSS